MNDPRREIDADQSWQSLPAPQRIDFLRSLWSHHGEWVLGEDLALDIPGPLAGEYRGASPGRRADILFSMRSKWLCCLITESKHDEDFILGLALDELDEDYRAMGNGNPADLLHIGIGCVAQPLTLGSWSLAPGQWVVRVSFQTWLRMGTGLGAYARGHFSDDPEEGLTFEHQVFDSMPPMARGWLRYPAFEMGNGHCLAAGDADGLDHLAHPVDSYEPYPCIEQRILEGRLRRP